MPFPWAAVALAGSSIFEAIIAGLNKPKGLKAFQEQTIREGRALMTEAGLSPEEQAAMFGLKFENVRGQQKNVNATRTDTLARSGNLGTGTELSMSQKDSWESENLVTEAKRNLALMNQSMELAKKQQATQMLATASGSAASTQGGGPPLTELLINAMLLDKYKKTGDKKKTALGDNPEDMGSFLQSLGLGYDSSPTSLYKEAQDRIGNTGFDPEAYWA